MAKMSSAVIRQVQNGYIVVIFIPGTPGTSLNVETETYYPDITTATAAIAAAL